MPKIKFYASQIGGLATTPLAYTSPPLRLLRADVLTAISLLPLIPSIIFPLSPLSSGALCELYPSWANIYAVLLHLILIALQLPFLLSFPLWLVLPLWSNVLFITLFWIVNSIIWLALNGWQVEHVSSAKFARSDPRHRGEKWLFLNGVAAGCVSSS